jgi:hypothetical protein
VKAEGKDEELEGRGTEKDDEGVEEEEGWRGVKEKKEK